MFARFKKPETTKTSPLSAVVGAGAAARAPAPEPAQQVAARPTAGLAAARPAAAPKPAAEAVAADKERKRKDRLAELKVELHKRLLEQLNLAALEHASEASLKSEIAAIAS